MKLWNVVKTEQRYIQTPDSGSPVLSDQIDS